MLQIETTTNGMHIITGAALAQHGPALEAKIRRSYMYPIVCYYDGNLEAGKRTAQADPYILVFSAAGQSDDAAERTHLADLAAEVTQN